MRRVNSAPLWGAALMILLGASIARSADSSDPELIIQADKIETDPKTKRTRVSGDVDIQRGSERIIGQSAQFDPGTGEGSISGAARYRDEEAGIDISAEKVRFDSLNALGRAVNVDGSLSEYNIRAASIERLEEYRYLIEDGSITTCECDSPEENPAWAIASSSADVTIEGYAHLKHARFLALGVPIIYFPYALIPVKIKRATGFLPPIVGYSRARGIDFANSFFWAPASNVDLTLTHRYITGAPDQYEAEARYILAPMTTGKINMFYTPHNERWRLKSEHRQKLDFDIDLYARIDKESENGVNRDYALDLYERSTSYSESYLNLTKDIDEYHFKAAMREEVERSDGAISSSLQLPALSISKFSTPIGKSSFYSELETSLQSHRLKSDRVAQSDYTRTQMDFFPTISRPIEYGPWMTLTPSASYRTTWYSKGQIDPASPEESDSFSREYYQLRVDARAPTFEKSYGDSFAPINQITPEIDWNYIPGLEYDGADRERARKINEIDYAGDPTNIVAFSITDSLLTGRGSQLTELARFYARQPFDARAARRSDIGDDDRRPWKPLNIVAELKLPEKFLIRIDANYDHYSGKIAKSFIELGFKYKDSIDIALERLHELDATDSERRVSDTFFIRYRPTQRVSLDYSAIYDETRKSSWESIFRIGYDAQCYSLIGSFSRRLIRDENAADRRFESDDAFRLSFTLKGLGDISSAASAALLDPKL